MKYQAHRPGEIYIDIELENFFDMLEVVINATCDMGQMYVDQGGDLESHEEVRRILIKGAKYYRQYVKKEFKKLDDR